MKAKVFINGIESGSYTKAEGETVSDFMDNVQDVRADLTREAYREANRVNEETVIVGKKNGVGYVAGTVADLIVRKVLTYCDYKRTDWCITLSNGKAFFGKSFEDVYNLI